MVVEGKEKRVEKEEEPCWHSPWDPRNNWETVEGMAVECCKQSWSTWDS